MGKPLRLGLAGFGLVGRRHATAISATQGVELAAVIDRVDIALGTHPVFQETRCEIGSCGRKAAIHFRHLTLSSAWLATFSP